MKNEMYEHTVKIVDNTKADSGKSFGFLPKLKKIKFEDRIEHSAEKC
jgi:hypothetical protein